MTRNSKLYRYNLNFQYTITHAKELSPKPSQTQRSTSFTGVEKFTTEMKKHKVVVTGKIDPQKVLKKLRKKTGKRVEIVVDKEEQPKDASAEGNLTKPNVCPPFFDCFKESEILFMLSEENPNACCIMW